MCDRGFISGDDSGGFEREKSNDVCFEVAAPPSPPSPPIPQGIDTNTEERGVTLVTPPPAPTEPPLGTTLTDRMPLQFDTLPATGSPRRSLLLLAGLTLAIGGALIAPGRRRR